MSELLYQAELSTNFAEIDGFEPTTTDRQSAIIPFHYTSIKFSQRESNPYR